MKMALEKWHIPSAKELMLMLLCYDAKGVNFQNQNLFTNQRSFNRAVERLHKGGLFKVERKIVLNGFLKTYSLTLDGLAMSQMLRDYQNANGKA